MRRQELATLFSAESAANFAIYMKSNSSAVDPAVAPTDFAEMELARNMLTVIPEGWDLGQIEPKQPGPLYEMFQRQALMGFCRCTNMPYPLAAGTAMQSNFSSYKGDIRNVWKPEVVVEQDNIEERIIDPIFMWFLQAAIYVPGLLDGAPPIDQIDYQWNWPPLPDIDPAETVATNAERMATGQATPSMIHSENGQDWETEVARFAQDLGVTVPEVKKALFDKYFGLVAPPSTQEQQQQQPQGVTQ
jgi:capsid protein